MGGAPFLPRARWWGIGVGDAGCERAGAAAAGFGAFGRIVQVVGPFAVDVASAVARTIRGCGSLLVRGSRSAKTRMTLLWNRENKSNLLDTCAAGEAAGRGGWCARAAVFVEDFGGKGFMLLAIAGYETVGMRSNIEVGNAWSLPSWIIFWRSTATLPLPLLLAAILRDDGTGTWTENLEEKRC